MCQPYLLWPGRHVLIPYSLVMCWARLEAQSQAKPSSFEPDQAQPSCGLHAGFGLGLICPKPKAWALSPNMVNNLTNLDWLLTGLGPNGISFNFGYEKQIATLHVLD